MSEPTAYHEAGHALLAVLLGGRVQSVTIAPDWDDGPERFGDTQVAWPRGRFTERELCEREILISLAGPVAEMLHTGDPFHPGLVAEWADDWRQAWQAAAALARDPQRRMALLEQLTRQVYRLLERDDHWAALGAVVDALLAHERLEAEEIEEIVAYWIA